MQGQLFSPRELIAAITIILLFYSTCTNHSTAFSKFLQVIPQRHKSREWSIRFLNRLTNA